MRLRLGGQARHLPGVRESRAELGLAIAAVMAAIVVGNARWVQPATADLILAAGLATALASFVHRAVARPGGKARAGLGFVLGIMAAAAVLMPAVSTLRPGMAVVRQTVRSGELVHLPAVAHAHARMLVHAELPPDHHATVDYTVAGAHASVAGHLEQFPELKNRGLVALSSRHQVTDIKNLDLVEPEDVVVAYHGESSGPLEVTVFRQVWSPLEELELAVVLLALATVLIVREPRIPSYVLSLLFTAVLFGLLVDELLTPSSPVGEELALLWVAISVGVVAHRPMSWLAQLRAPQRADS